MLTKYNDKDVKWAVEAVYKATGHILIHSRDYPDCLYVKKHPNVKVSMISLLEDSKDGDIAPSAQMIQNEIDYERRRETL